VSVATNKSYSTYQTKDTVVSCDDSSFRVSIAGRKFVSGCIDFVNIISRISNQTTLSSELKSEKCIVAVQMRTQT
jgi:hypothetical protein